MLIVKWILEGMLSNLFVSLSMSSEYYWIDLELAIQNHQM